VPLLALSSVAVGFGRLDEDPPGPPAASLKYWKNCESGLSSILVSPDLNDPL
jgi:hypothetical protein